MRKIKKIAKKFAKRGKLWAYLQSQSRSAIGLREMRCIGAGAVYCEAVYCSHSRAVYKLEVKR